MNYVIWVVGLIVFLYITSFSNLDQAFYKNYMNYFSYLRVFEFDKVNTWSQYSTCTRDKIEWDTILGYCMFPWSQRELFIPLEEDKWITTTIKRECWNIYPNCKDEYINKWMIYYKNNSILGCQYWLEWKYTPNLTWVLNTDILDFKLSLTYTDWNVEDSVLLSIDLSSLAWITSEDILTELINQINLSSNTVFDCFTYKLSDDKLSLLIWLVNEDYQLNEVFVLFQDWTPIQDNTITYKVIENYCRP